jgi:hypothetical protein
MPIATVQDLPPEVTPELFDAVSAKLDAENNPPEQERLIPAIAEVAQGESPPRSEQFIYELHEVVTP